MFRLIDEITFGLYVTLPPYLTCKNLSTLQAMDLFHIILKISSHYVLYVNRIHPSAFVTDIMCLL